MKEDKLIKEISDKLNAHGSSVREELWSGVQANIAINKVSAGTSVLLKSLMVVGVVSVIALGYFGLSGDNESKEVVATNSIDKQETLSIPAEEEKETFTVSEIVKEEVKPKPIEKAIRTVKTTTPVKQEQSLATTNENNLGSDFKLGKYISIFPASITPNGDGINDFFFIKSKDLKDYDVVIVNHQNTVVWRSSSPEDKWDGRDLYGNKVFKGDYTVFLSAETSRGNKINEYRTLSIKY